MLLWHSNLTKKSPAFLHDNSEGCNYFLGHPVITHWPSMVVCISLANRPSDRPHMHTYAIVGFVTITVSSRRHAVTSANTLCDYATLKQFCQHSAVVTDNSRHPTNDFWRATRSLTNTFIISADLFCQAKNSRNSKNSKKWRNVNINWYRSL